MCCSIIDLESSIDCSERGESFFGKATGSRGASEVGNGVGPMRIAPWVSEDAVGVLLAANEGVESEAPVRGA